MNLLNCHQINELLSAYLENELDTTTTLTVANHLEKCLSCEKELKALTNVSNLVKTAIREADKTDLSLVARSNKINSLVKDEITSKIKATENLVLASSNDNSIKTSQNNIVKLNLRPKWSALSKKIFLSLAASVAIICLSLFTITYYATSTGPLLSGAARNHQFCSAIEISNIGWHKGYPKERLLQASNINLPKLDALGVDFSDLHPCKVYKAPFLHMMYSKGDKQISLYYGSQEAVNKFQEKFKTITPNELYLHQESNLQIAAISTQKNNLWIVAGDLTKEEINAITSELAINSLSNTEESKLFH